MPILQRYSSLKVARRARVRKALQNHGTRPRLSVFRSNKHFSAQIIDDQKGHTLAAASGVEVKKDKKITKLMEATAVGELLARKAKEVKVSKVMFDRGSYRYHGRVQAFADAARKGGLVF